VATNLADNDYSEQKGLNLRNAHARLDAQAFVD